jgi:hypothetical protein
VNARLRKLLAGRDAKIAVLRDQVSKAPVRPSQNRGQPKMIEACPRVR